MDFNKKKKEIVDALNENVEDINKAKEVYDKLVAKNQQLQGAYSMLMELEDEENKKKQEIKTADQNIENVGDSDGSNAEVKENQTV